MRVFQIGAAGGVGRRLAARLVERGDEVSGMHRAEAQSTVIEATGAIPVLGDLIEDSIEELAERFHGHDAVVFSAGAHGTGVEFTSLIDGKGLEKAAEAALKAGVFRFILVSAFPDVSREREPDSRFEHYMRVKKAADGYLSGTDLDWLIVRPSVLLDGQGDGLVAAGLALPYGTVHRENVAEFIAEALHTPRLNRTLIELNDGAESFVSEVARLAEATSRPHR